MAFWLGCDGISTIVGSGVSWALGHTNNATLHPWQLVFVVGLFSSEANSKIILIACSGDRGSNILFRYSLGIHSPLDISRLHFLLSIRSARLSLASLPQPHRSQTRQDPWYQVREAFTDLKIYFIFASALCLGIINGATANFWTTIQKSFGFGPLKSVLYQMPSGAFQFTGTIIAGLSRVRFRTLWSLLSSMGMFPVWRVSLVS
jgi:hypothetical protein